jgi:PAS domain S-box-containing protein
MSALAGSYNYAIVVLSAGIAVLAAWTSLDLAERVTAARGAIRLAWLISGAIAMGIGIWSMHYTGMLAFRLPVPVLYHWPTVLLSLLAGIVASAIALFVVSRARLGWPAAVAGSVCQGSGIAALHYISMDSMRFAGMHHYSPAVVALSILVAIAGALLSLRLTFLFRNEAAGRKRRRVASAVLMGTAICLMHYTGMAAATFTSSLSIPNPAHAVRVSLLGTAAFVTLTVMVLGAALLTSLVDRRQERSALLDGLFEQAPQAIALMNGENLVVRVNQEFTRIFGYTQEESLGRPLGDLIAPGDLRDGFQRLVELGSQGQRVEVEAVRQRKDGSRLHVFGVGVALSVPGGQIASCVMYRDITERKQTEDRLREYEKAVEGLEEMIVVVDSQYRYLIANRAFLSYMGLEREQLIGRFVHDVTTEEVFDPLVKAKLDECFRGNVVKYELKYLYPARGERDLSVSYFPIEGAGAIDRVACVLQDVTERKQAEMELRSLTGRILSLEDEERRRLARELHDTTSQSLAALCMNLSVASESAGVLNPRAQAAIAESAALADQCLREIRTVSYLLHPPELDELGLQYALSRYIDGFIQRSGIPVEIEAPPDLGRLPQLIETTVFRIVQESLTNVHRHSGSDTARVRLAKDLSNLVLEVEDAGDGIRADAPSGVGIASMRERLQQVNGRLETISGPGGTVIRATIPLPAGI